MRQLKILSNGLETHVLDTDGHEVTTELKIREVVWRHRAGQMATVELICDMVGSELVGEMRHG